MENLKIQAEEIHKPFIKKFDREIVMVKCINHTWCVDIVDINELKEYNKCIRYFINIIDILSKYAWAIIIKDKSALSVCNAFEQLFQKVKPKLLWTDSGKEFYNKKFQELLQKHNIKLYSVY